MRYMPTKYRINCPKYSERQLLEDLIRTEMNYVDYMFLNVSVQVGKTVMPPNQIQVDLERMYTNKYGDEAYSKLLTFIMSDDDFDLQTTEDEDDDMDLDEFFSLLGL